MKKTLLFLSLFIILGLSPNISNAITQNQINTSIQIVCPTNQGNFKSGSGTIISSNGVVITNKHVVTNEDKSIIQNCIVGMSNGINNIADFSKEYITETKYYSNSDDLDVAILYIINGSNFNYYNIFSSNSDLLKIGDSIEAMGYPAYNDLKLTKTSGEFVKKGSGYIKHYLNATTYINPGNSGGTAYNYDKFIGVPTFYLPTSSGIEYYFLSINSIKNWLQSTLGSNYLTDILGYRPDVTKPIINLPEDHIPPSIKNAPRDVFWYNSYGENGESVKWNYGIGYDKFLDMYVANSYRTIEVMIRNSMCDNPYVFCLSEMDSSSIDTVYYSYSSNVTELLSNQGTEYIIRKDGDWNYLTPRITLPNIEGTYYIGLRFKDSNGNISEPYILTYVYEKDNFLNLKNIKFYSDPEYKNMIGNYDIKMTSTGWIYPQYFQYCATKYKDVYVKWQYEDNYPQYSVNHYNSFIGEMSAAESQIKGGITSTSINKYKVSNLNLGTETNLYYGQSICYKGDCGIAGAVTSFLLKPQSPSAKSLFEGTNRTIMFAYDKNLPFDFLCGSEDFSLGRNQWKQAYYNLLQGKPLVEDSLQFDKNQQKIADSLVNQKDQNTSKTIDLEFAKKQAGKILLQVESRGEAWYVNPKDNKKYYMADGNKAYGIMRNLGVGITNKNLEKIKANKILAKSNSGKIFLQVEAKGEAYYIDFSGVSHYLKDGAAAYNIMRSLGLGITNNDLNKISGGNLQ